MTIKEMRELLHLSQVAFGKKYNIPKRSIENWEMGVSKCPEYVHDMLERCVQEDAKGMEARIDFTDMDTVKMTIDRLQNETVAPKYGFSFQTGQECCLHVFGQVEHNIDSYYLVLNNGKRTGKCGFPMAYAHDADGNKYMINLITPGYAGAFRD